MAGQVVQGIDTLTSAMKGNIIPDQEYLLQGSLLDSHIEVFKHRLRGLCDNTLGGEEQFCEREMVRLIKDLELYFINFVCFKCRFNIVFLGIFDPRYLSTAFEFASSKNGIFRGATTFTKRH